MPIEKVSGGAIHKLLKKFQNKNINSENKINLIKILISYKLKNKIK